MILKKEFINRINDMLGTEAKIFFNELENPPFKGLRVNTLKCSTEKLNSLISGISPSPFNKNGFYINEFDGAGKNPLHHAGAYYMQEPSAMSAVTVLKVQNGDKVLDLCAAPGGKSTQIAAELGGTGLLWSNEFVRERASALISNIERMGITNAVVSSARPDELEKNLEGFFDKILVDAPCSGEGMIRKDNPIADSWTAENVKMCAVRQLKILDSAAVMLKSGGMLVYSTCTYSMEENEQVVKNFLSKHNEFEQVYIKPIFGRQGFDKKSLRVFPMDGGEGHFVALLHKKGELIQEEAPKTEVHNKFLDENFKNDFYGFSTEQIGDYIYLVPSLFKKAKGVLRAGIPIGAVKKNRIEPSHALFTAAGFEPKQIIDFSIESEALKKFLHGEEIECDMSLKGYVQVRVEGIPLGFGKAVLGRLKNHYPKGLRTL